RDRPALPERVVSSLTGADLLDREAIQRVEHQYFSALDVLDWAAVAACFSDDVTAVYDGVRLAGGRDQLRTALESGRARQAAGIAELRLWWHLAGPSHIAVDGACATAETPAVAHIVHRRADGQETMLVRGLRYLDVLRRTEAGWLIAD